MLPPPKSALAHSLHDFEHCRQYASCVAEVAVAIRAAGGERLDQEKEGGQQG